jgi:hypothetical protein
MPPKLGQAIADPLPQPSYVPVGHTRLPMAAFPISRLHQLSPFPSDLAGLNLLAKSLVRKPLRHNLLCMVLEINVTLSAEFGNQNTRILQYAWVMEPGLLVGSLRPRQPFRSSAFYSDCGATGLSIIME